LGGIGHRSSLADRRHLGDLCAVAHDGHSGDVTQPPSRPRALFGMNRLEAFSDGVFAIAITLLVLDLAVPTADELAHGSLAAALAREWPSYFAYLVSFLIIGIIWVNHHSVCTFARSADRAVLFANLFLLLTVSTLPFPTRLVAEYLTAGNADAHTAMAIYSATMALMGLGFTVLFLSVTRDAVLARAQISRSAQRAALRRFGGGGLVYLGLIGLAFVNAVVTLVVHGILALYYCFDQLAPARAPGQE
jgi:uncharacterized membrane protein